MKRWSRASMFRSVVLLAATAGCSADSGAGLLIGGGGPDDGGRVTLHVDAEGGQTGAEGSCGLASREELDFSAEDLRALVEGTHRATLGYVNVISRLPDLDVSAEVERELSVHVRLLGDPEVDLKCGGRMDQQVEVTLSFDEPALDVIFEQRLSAFSADFAVLHMEFEPDEIAAMQLPGVDHTSGVSTLLLAFRLQGLRGRMDLHGTCGGKLILPSDARCEEPFRPEIEIDQPVYGVRPQDALETARQALSALGPLPLEWDDGTRTTLEVSLGDEPSYACGDWAALVTSQSDAKLEVPLRVQLRTEDGRVDLSMSAHLNWTVYPEQGYLGRRGWDGGWSLGGWVIATPEALRESGALPGFSLPDDRAVQVDFGVHVGADLKQQWSLEIVTSGYSAEVAGRPAGAREELSSENVTCFGEGREPVASAERPADAP